MARRDEHSLFAKHGDDENGLDAWTRQRSDVSTLQLAAGGTSYVRYVPRDDGTHKQERYERVSHVLDTGLPFYEGVSEDARLAAAELGTEVHKVGHELALSPEPEELANSYPGELRGYARAWLLFQRDAEFRPWALEEPLSSDKLRVAGRPDAIGESRRGPTVIDYTIGSPTARKKLQTAIYEVLWKETTGDRRKFRRVEVHLKPDGRYSFRPHRDPNDIFAFIGLLQFHRWKKGAG